MDVIDTLKSADYYLHAHDKLAACVQKGLVTGYIDKIKYIQ